MSNERVCRVCGCTRETGFPQLGDTIYLHDFREKPRKSVYRAKVMGITVTRERIGVGFKVEGESNFAQMHWRYGGNINFAEFGKNAFFTVADALAALSPERDKDENVA